MMRALGAVLGVLLSLSLAACGNPYLSWRTSWTGRLSDETVIRHASGGRLDVRHARVITGNDAAFLSKLELIREARASIDAAYYIYADDYSSSVLTEALLEAARRGVRVRLLVDYHTNYRHLDLFTMMEARARGGAGSLEVRLYNRPTRHVVMDAAYVTLGCGRAPGAAAACTAARLAEVGQRFAGEQIDGRPAAELGISNLDVAASGLFLSGLYAKRPDVAAMAVIRGPEVPPGSAREALARLAQLRLRAQGGPEGGLAARLALAFLLPADGETATPLRAAVAPHLPAEREGVAEALRDWDYLTDFTHHKLLLVDERRLQLGGRNIEDSYHMRANPLVRKYIFLDTDLRAELTDGGRGLRAAFEALWSFRRMVATTAEVRQHAPNDFVANLDAFGAAARACAGVAGAAAREACVGQEFGARALDRPAREAAREAAMRERARRYWGEYPYVGAAEPAPTFPVDPGAFFAYVENVPFLGGPRTPPTRRAYGAVDGREAEHGKRIHALWVAGLEHACRTATAAAPKRVILHNAYFFPPANLTRALGRMVDGDLDCRHVTVAVLTNSIEMTDLNVMNLLARQSIKAFAEHYLARRDPERSARFGYYEYLRPDPARVISLHTKVSVLGDDVFVGSANADVRSYMMDSNNGMFVRGAPGFVAEYVGHLDGLMRDPARARDATELIARTPRRQLMAADLAAFWKTLQPEGADPWLDESQQQIAEVALVQILDLVYRLTRDMLAGGREADRAAERFNRIFKPI
jgi:phosphatidylserine/phosphatidylglycerophosphate/cardiolipin synthase-like enzyme